MPWKECTAMSEREELVARYQHGGESMSDLAKAYGVSRKTGYRWVDRAATGEPLTDRSRRPHASPGATPPAMEQEICGMRDAHPTWGARKIHHALVAKGIAAPAPSTIHTILKRNGYQPLAQPQAVWTRFESPQPNDLWQMDFKGWHPLRSGRVHPLTILDDHSRFLLDIQCVQQQTLAVVQPILTAVFERYGLPWQILCDNGAPWGSSHRRAMTRFEVWMMQLDVRVIHGRPYHPQTQGKLERLHRTLKADVFAGSTYADLTAAQQACDAFRGTYNLDRPHEALGFDPPVHHYRASPRPMPAVVHEPVYPDDALLRKVARQGTIRLGNRSHVISKALSGQYVGVIPTASDGVFRVTFYSRDLCMIDLTKATDSVTHVYEHL